MLAWIDFLKDITQETDKIALKYFNADDLKVEIKADHTPVSQADQSIEEFIRDSVAKQHPELAILGEEYGETKTQSDLKLIIDPIDGTKNFIAGLPFFATLLAIEASGEIIAGLVSAPATGDKWWAAKGEGAYHNGKAIHVSKVDRLAMSLAFHGSLFGTEASDPQQPLLTLLSKTYRQRGFADYYQHMLVAMGKGEFCADFKLKAWDIAPISIIVNEAGGICTDTNGDKTIYGGNAISSNGLFHEEILSYIAGLS